jgi:hypothetical protein
VSHRATSYLATSTSSPWPLCAIDIGFPRTLCVGESTRRGIGHRGLAITFAVLVINSVLVRL